MSPSPSAPSSRAAWLLPGAALAALGIAAYANSVHGEFLLDDASSVVRNPGLARVWPPWAPLLAPAAGGARGRPVANLTLAWNHAVGGLNPAGYHAVNIAIHVVAGLLLFGILRQTFARPVMGARVAAARTPLAFAVAALWVLHPLATETVSYVAQRTEGLMALFYLGTLYSVIRGACATDGRAWYLLAVVTSLLGMASKEVMVTAPVVILVYDRTFLAGSFRAAWTARRRLYLGLAAGWVLLGLLLVGIGDRGAGLAVGTSPAAYARAELPVVLRYAGLVFWPHPLVFDYGPGLGTGGFPAAALVAVTALVAVMAALLRRGSPAGFALFWFLAILAPTSSFVPVALQPMAESRAYLPMAGLLALAATAAFLALGRASWVILAAAALVLGVATHRRNEDYRSALRMWTDTVAKRPLNPRAHCNLGSALLANHDTEAGMRELREAVRVDPDDANSNLDLGVAEADSGRMEEAARHIRRALDLRPGMPEAHFDQGWLDAKSGRTAEAIEQYDRALEISPRYVDAHCNLADLLSGLGRYAEAIPHYEAALDEGPPDAQLYFNLAFARIRTGQVAAAVADYRRALELRPDFAEARHNLDMLEALQRR